MNYVEKNFFKFPVKMYDLYSMLNAENEEDKKSIEDGYIEPIQVQYATGYKVCRPENKMSWNQSYHKGQSIEEVEEVGFPTTVVNIQENMETFQLECLWDILTFEKELNKRMAHIA